MDDFKTHNGDWRVAAYDSTVAAALEAAHQHGVYLIARLQDGRQRRFVAHNGRLELASTGRMMGLGVQVFSPSGHCGFASTDRVDPAEAAEAVRRAADLAHAAESAGAEPSLAVFALQAQVERAVPYPAQRLAAVDPGQHRDVFLEAHRAARGVAGDFSFRSSHSVLDEEWRIVRSDGTDVRYGTPRASAGHEFTSRGKRHTASASAVVTGADASLLLEAEGFERFRRRAAQAVRRARDVADAPGLPSGSYRVVLDHSMAKALAHESFGHAVETDTAGFSILASAGRLRIGERVAPEHVSIVDESIPGDFAYQPISANGLPRQPVRIIDRGILASGLGDIFSAAGAGSMDTGAARAHSFRSAPLPRMSNIRLECEISYPLEDPDETLEPADLALLLREAGLAADGQPTLLLAHMTGGQANPRLGDFVFNCSAIYELSAGAAPRRPAVLSGNSLSALSSIVAGVGGLRLDAAGLCGKGGQYVPTAGGSHAYLVLEPHPRVMIGASA